MKSIENAELERLRYWQGQRLISDDFREQGGIEDQLRWWHNRAIHNAFGISSGFEVTAASDHVIVQPGLAYDSAAREILSTKNVRVPFPSEPRNHETDFLLLLVYQETAPCKNLSRGDRCVEQAGNFRFCWKISDHYHIKDGVPIARLGFSGKNWNKPGPVPGHYSVRALRRPYLSCGTTFPGLGWKEWVISDKNVGLEIEIDTSPAGFTQIPCYFAWLRGLPSPKDDDAIKQKAIFYVLLHLHLTQVSSNNFILRLFLPSSILQSAALDVIQQNRVSVFWIGFQPELSKANIKIGGEKWE